MGWEENSLTVDDWGVRVGDEAFPLRAFSWGAVTRIRAYAVTADGGTSSVIELHHDGGCEEILGDWEGFPAVAAGISAHLPGICPDWSDAVRGLSAAMGPVVVWERSASPGAAAASPPPR